jgi:lipopolysaccharide biosynthesis regulator YciM
MKRPKFITVFTTAHKLVPNLKQTDKFNVHHSVSLKFILSWGPAQLVEALRYKPERCGFDSRWYHWNFSLT